MKKLFYFMMAMAVMFTSCDNESEVDVKEAKTSMSFIHVMNQTKAGGGGAYKRGNAPVYVKGIEATVSNYDYPVDPVKGTFEFVEFGNEAGDPMVLDGITVGKNKVDLVGIPEYTAGNKMLTVIKGANREDDLDTRAAYYWEQINKNFPIYAEYLGSNDTHITVGEGVNNTCKVEMLPQTGRINIVIEPAEGFRCRLTGGTDPAEMGFGTTSSWPVEAKNGKCSAMCFNSVNVKDGYTVKGLKLEVFVEKGADTYKEGIGTKVAEADLSSVVAITGKNITHLIRTTRLGMK